MTYRIEKKTPNLNWFTIHNNIDDLELSKDILKDILNNYNNDPECKEKGWINGNGFHMVAYDGSDLHEFRIIEFNIEDELDE
jgi:hypothetical protein